MACHYQYWVDSCHKFHKFISRLFKRWALFVYHYPISIILISLFISFAFISGFYKFNIYGQSERIFYPQESKIFKDLNRAEKSFDYYIQQEEFILYVDGDDGSVINETVFRIALDIHNGVIKIAGFDDFCVLSHGTTCSVLSPLEIFNFDPDNLYNIQSKLVSKYMSQSYLMDNGQPPSSNYPQLFGNFYLNATSSNIFTTNVLRTVYPVKFGKTRKQYEKNALWEKKLTDYMNSWKPIVEKKGYKLIFNTVRSMDDSVEKNTEDNLFLITCSIGAMVLFCAAAMTRIGSKVKGHFLLSLLGVGAVTFGIGAGFGLTLYTGTPYVGFVGVLPFLVLGVGIDDMFIIVNKVDQLHGQYKGDELLGKVLEQVGFTITMTTVTDLVAFVIGTVSTFPAVQIFCIYAFLSIFFSYLLIVTLFLAMLSFDIKRMEKNKMDCFPCVLGKEKDVLLASQRMDYPSVVLQKYAQLLMTHVGKSFVMIITALLIALGIYGTLNIDLNFDYKILGADESEYVSWMKLLENNFPIGKFQMDIVSDDPNIDYSNGKIQNKFYKLNEAIMQNEYFDNRTINWMTSYLDWRRSRKLNITSIDFYATLNEFLSLHYNFNRDIVFDANNKIIASRIHVYTIDCMNWLFRRDAYLSLNEELKDMNLFYAISFQFIYLSQLVTIVMSTLINVVICCVVILFITLPFVVNPIVSILLLLTFACFITELLGVMYLWNLSLNSITMIVMVMSIGFTVDYSCHITHAYLVNNKKTPEERVEQSIMTMGSNVLKGGLSTLIGIIVLSVSSSKLFVLFFKMMFTIIVLGLVHGMVILPVFLTIFCRNQTSATDVSKDEEMNVLGTGVMSEEKEEDALMTQSTSI